MGFVFIQKGDGESRMNDHPVSDLGLGKKGQVRLDLVAEVIDLRFPRIVDPGDSGWYGKAHRRLSFGI